MSLLDTASLIVTPNGYKEGKLYSVIPSDGSGDMSVTRATTATRVNSAGLVELVPYNLLSYSQDFSNAYWFGEPGNTITSNTTTAPDGTLTADTFTATAGNEINVHNFNGFNLADGTFTYSVYLKNNGTNLIEAYLFKVGVGFAARGEINFSAGTFTASIGTGSIENVGNGWFRVSLTNTYTAGTFTTGTFTTSTTGTRSVFAWGAQLNEGTLKSYQKTETRLNIPRLDYSNGTCPSLLVEPQRTNVCLNSNDLSGANWINQTLNTTLTRIQSGGPDGNSFDRLVVTGSGYVGRYVQGIAQVGTSTTFTAYLRGSGSVQLGVFNMGQTYLETINLTSEWVRYENIVTTATNNTYMDVGVYLYGGTQVDVSSCQVEFASYATSYIPTTSASVTRNADVISKTGISSLIGSSEYTLFWDGKHIPTGQYNSFASCYQASNLNNSVRFYRNNSNNAIRAALFNVSSGLSLDLNSGITTENAKCALRVKAGDYAFFVNGSLVASSSSALAPSSSLDALNIQYFDATQSFQQELKGLAFWKTALTNTQLAALTTI